MWYEIRTSSEIQFTQEVQILLEELIREHSFKSYTFNVSLGGTPDEEYLSVILRATVHGEKVDGNRTTLSLILKSASANPLYREIIPIWSIFHREIYIYTHVLPELESFQKGKYLERPFKSYATVYKASMQDMSETLILEDLKAAGFQLHDCLKPLDFHHALLVMREYGKLHALSFALRLQNPRKFKEMYNNLNEAFLNDFEEPKEMYDIAKASCKEALKALHPINDKVLYNKFQLLSRNLLNIVRIVVRKESAHRYGVIGHGDGWVNNFFFKYDDPLEPMYPLELRMIDWQFARAASPALDITSFLFTCTDKKLRDDYYNDLIKEYYKSLSSFLFDLGGDVKSSFPFEMLQDHLKSFGVYGLYMAVLRLYPMSRESATVQDYCTRMRDIIGDCIIRDYEFYKRYNDYI